MSGFSVSLKDNSPEVLKALQDASILALKEIGEKATQYAKEKCPVDTGALRSSIDYVVDDNNVSVGSDLPYAAAQEYGEYHHKVGSPHFLRDSFSDHLDEYNKIIKDNLQQ